MFRSSYVPVSATKKTIRNLKIVNLASTQAGIYWQTETKELGSMIYGKSENNLQNLIYDERDIQDNKGAYINHYILLKNLVANSRYYFKIVSNNTLIGSSNNQPFQFQTPADSKSNSKMSLVYGKAVAKNGLGLENAVVILNVDGVYPLFALTKPTGEWLIPGIQLFEQNSNASKTVLQNDKISIEILSEDSQKSQIITDLKHLNPIPETILIGKDYQFTSEEKVLAAKTSVQATKATTVDIDMIFPKEGAIIDGAFPLIKGLAIVDNEILVTIKSNKVNQIVSVTKTKADKNGTWMVSAPIKLVSGNYSVEATSKNASGENTTLKRSFTIAKSGEQVKGEATPEAEVPTATNPPTAEPTSSAAPTSGFNPGNLIVSSAALIILGFGLLLAF